jgi:SAM-dependent methyltransferase
LKSYAAGWNYLRPTSDQARAGAYRIDYGVLGVRYRTGQIWNRAIGAARRELGGQTMKVSRERVLAGQAVYTKRSLRAYDLVVLGVSNRFLWKCPTRRLVAHYDRHVSANHLDVGVGTGYFLDNCRFPSAAPRVALMDLNQDTLDFAGARVARYKPETYVRSVLDPIRLDAPKFDSVGINYLLHCVPGAIESKSVAFDHLKALMNPGAVFFGSTLLQGGVPRNWFAKRLMDVYNRKGIFSNEADNLEGLTNELKQRFDDVLVEVVGCAALFSGRA